MAETDRAQVSDNREERDRRWIVVAVVALVFAVLAPLASLAEHRDEFQSAGISAVPPFVFLRVAAFQLVFTLPALYLLGFYLSRLVRLPVGVICGVAVGVTLLGAVSAEAISSQSPPTSRVELHGVRLAWCAVLQMPWALLAGAAVNRVTSERMTRGWNSILWVDVPVVLALLVLPVIFVREEIERQDTLIDDLFRGKQQYQAALAASHCVVALGAETIMERPAESILSGLQTEVSRLRKAVEVPIGPASPEPQRLQRAVDLISLGELAAAETMLEGLESPRATYHAGRIAALRRNWSDALDRFGEVIDTLGENRPLADEELALLRAAMERRVNNLRRAGRFRDAETELKQAMEDWPAARDRFLLQLAFHYKLAGRGADAVDYFMKAANANPEFSELAVTEISRLRGQAQGCLIRLNRATSR